MPPVAAGMPLVRLPSDASKAATLELGSAVTTSPTGRALLGTVLANWPKADRGELAQLEDDDPTWTILGWSSGSGLDEATDVPQHWDGASPSSDPRRARCCDLS